MRTEDKNVNPTRLGRWAGRLRTALFGERANDLAVCTVIAKNRLSQARVLAASLRRHHPEIPLFALLIDSPEGYFEPSAEPFTIVPLPELGIPDLQSMRFRYTVAEMCDAVVPGWLEYLFARRHCTRLLYLDSDLLVLARLDPLFEMLGGVSILLSPHIIRPLVPGSAADELEFLRAGVYNSGLIGLADRPAARRMLGWWQARLTHHAQIQPTQAQCGNQHWLDFVPALFAGHVGCITDPGCNVAYWNLHERSLDLDREPRACGETLRCFHFSGFDPDEPGRITRHRPHWTLESLGKGRALFDDYRARLLAAGWQETSRWPYTYDTFANGVRIAPVLRRLFGDGTQSFGDPFTSGKGSLLSWLASTDDDERAAAPPLSRALLQVWAARQDLQSAFPAVRGEHRAAFVAWAHRFASREEQLDPCFLPAPSAAPWSFASEGWLDAVQATRGWNVPQVAQAEAGNWGEFLRLTQGTGPLGVVYESPTLRADDPIHHNIVLSYGYVLARSALGRSRLSLLDWGGGLGHYYWFSKALIPEVELDYRCHDVPAIAQAGRRLNPQLPFCTPECDCSSGVYDLVLASGSLQYSQDWRATLALLAGAAAQYLFVTRLPLVEQAPSFPVIQRPYASGYDTEYVGWFINRAELLSAAGDLGLVLLREFVVDERPHVDGAPEQCAYGGFLFQPPRASRTLETPR